jgi:hypothetical protein
MRAVLLAAACICAFAILVAMMMKKETYSPRDGEAALVCYWAPPPPPMSYATRQDPSGLAMPSRTTYSKITNSEMTASPAPSNITAAPAGPSSVNDARPMPVAIRVQKMLEAKRLESLQEPLSVPPPYSTSTVSPGMQNIGVSPIPLPPTVPPTTKIPSLLDPVIGITSTPQPQTTAPPAFTPPATALPSFSPTPLIN